MLGSESIFKSTPSKKGAKKHLKDQKSTPAELEKLSGVFFHASLDFYQDDWPSVNEKFWKYVCKCYAQIS